MTAFTDLRTFALLFIAFVTAVALAQDQASLGNPTAQQAFINHNVAMPAKITVNGKGEIRLLAETASVNLRVSSSRPLYETAAEEVTKSIHKVQQMLQDLASSSKLGPDDEKELVTVLAMTFPARKAEDNAGEDSFDTQYASGRISVRFTSPELVHQFMRNISGDALMQTSWINWELTDVTKAKAERPAREAALVDALRNGQNWAKIMGKKVVQLVAIEDGYTSDGVEKEIGFSYDYRYMDWDAEDAEDGEADFQPPNMVLQQRITCVFQLE